jgi:hypothetical protein
MSSDAERTGSHREDLVAYVHGEIRGRRRRKIERWVARDAAARQEVEEIRALFEACREQPPREASPALRARLLDDFRRWKREREGEIPVDAESAIRGSLALYLAYLRYRLRTSGGFRALTVATAVAVHALVLTLVAGITFVTIDRRRQSTELVFLTNPEDPATASSDEDVIRPRPDRDPVVLEVPERVTPDLVEQDGEFGRDRSPDPDEIFRKIWEEVPRSRADRIRLTRWVLFARHAGDRRQDLIRRYGGTESTEASVRRGLAWLATNQAPEGRWDCERHGGYARYDVGVTSLALLAFLGAGNDSTRGPYADSTRRGIEYLLSVQEPDGRIGPDTRLERWTYLYNHALATQALMEGYLMSLHEEALREPISRALGFLVAVQNRDGGWRYTEPGESSDSSVTAWVLSTLALARRAGLLEESGEVFARARAWIDGATSEAGFTGYRERPREGEHPTGTTAAAFTALAAAGIDADPGSLHRARREALREFATAGVPDGTDDPVGTYFLANALFQIGAEAWDQWNARSVLPLAQRQEADGSWSPSGKYAPPGGRVASTALAVLTLETYYRYPRFLD